MFKTKKTKATTKRLTKFPYKILEYWNDDFSFKVCLFSRHCIQWFIHKRSHIEPHTHIPTPFTRNRRKKNRNDVNGRQCLIFNFKRNAHGNIRTHGWLIDSSGDVRGLYLNLAQPYFTGIHKYCLDCLCEAVVKDYQCIICIWFMLWGAQKVIPAKSINSLSSPLITFSRGNNSHRQRTADHKEMSWPIDSATQS